MDFIVEEEKDCFDQLKDDLKLQACCWWTLTECLVFLPACKTLLTKKSDGVKVSCIACTGDVLIYFVHIYISFFLSFLYVSHPFFSLLTCISVFIADDELSSHFRFTLLRCSDTVALLHVFGFLNKEKNLRKKKIPMGEKQVAAWTHLLPGRIRFWTTWWRLVRLIDSRRRCMQWSAMIRGDQPQKLLLHTETNPTVVNLHTVFLMLQFSLFIPGFISF